MKLAQSDFIEHDACPGCGSSRLTPSESISFQGRTIEYVRCVDCSLMFMHPMPNQSWYNAFYANLFWETKAAPRRADDPRVNERQWLKELGRARRNLACLERAGIGVPAAGRILEIGCAYGLIVRSIANHFGAVALGVEPSLVARRFAEQYVQVEIVAENVDGLDAEHISEPVDLVIMSHVLENIVDPTDALRRVGRVLRTGGTLLVETPSPFFSKCVSIYHPFVYSKRALIHLLGSAGFNVVYARYLGRPRSLLRPDDLTVVARSGIAGSVPSPTPAGAPDHFARLRKLGLRMARIVDRTVGPLDMALAQRVYRLSSDDRELITGLHAKIEDKPLST